MTTIFCTQCNQVFPGDPTEIDEEQILVPQRYSAFIYQVLLIKLHDRSQRDGIGVYTWNSLLTLWETHAKRFNLPSVTGDCVTFVNHPDDTSEGQSAELGRASLSYVRAVDELRREDVLKVLPDGKILYGQQDSGGPRKPPKPRLKLV
jgi:hypothetical protein